MYRKLSKDAVPQSTCIQKHAPISNRLQKAAQIYAWRRHLIIGLCSGGERKAIQTSEQQQQCSALSSNGAAIGSLALDSQCRQSRAVLSGVTLAALMINGL